MPRKKINNNAVKMVASTIAVEAVGNIGITAGFIMSNLAPITVGAFLVKKGLGIASGMNQDNIQMQKELKAERNTLLERRIELNAIDTTITHSSKRVRIERNNELKSVRKELRALDEALEENQKLIARAGSGIVIKALSSVDAGINKMGAKSVGMLKGAYSDLSASVTAYREQGLFSATMKIFSATQKVAGAIIAAPLLPPNVKAVAKAFQGDAAGALAFVGSDLVSKHMGGARDIGEKIIQKMFKSDVRDEIERVVSAISPKVEAEQSLRV